MTDHDAEFVLRVLESPNVVGRDYLIDAMYRSYFSDSTIESRMAMLFYGTIEPKSLQTEFEKRKLRGDTKSQKKWKLAVYVALLHRIEMNRRASHGRNNSDGRVVINLGFDFSKSSETVKKWARKFRDALDLLELSLGSKLTHNNWHINLLLDEKNELLDEEEDLTPEAAWVYKYIWFLQWIQRSKKSLRREMISVGCQRDKVDELVNYVFLVFIRNNLSWLPGPIVI
ncbi:MAG: hypothetical protein AAF541_06830 [Pseudomonadota bacterium]